MGKRKPTRIDKVHDKSTKMQKEFISELTSFLKENNVKCHSQFTARDSNGYSVLIAIDKNEDY